MEKSKIIPFRPRSSVKGRQPADFLSPSKADLLPPSAAERARSHAEVSSLTREALERLRQAEPKEQTQKPRKGRLHLVENKEI